MDGDHLDRVGRDPRGLYNDAHFSRSDANMANITNRRGVGRSAGH